MRYGLPLPTVTCRASRSSRTRRWCRHATSSGVARWRAPPRRARRRRGPRSIRAAARVDAAGGDALDPRILAGRAGGLAGGASRDTPELLHALLQHGANPNATTPDGLPILTVAVLAGTPSSIEALLAAGAKATRPDRRGNSALLDAVRVGREDIVLSMLAHGVSPDSRWDPEPPVVAAAKAGHGGILRALPAVHAQPDVRDEHGTSALRHRAAARGERGRRGGRREAARPARR